MSGSVIINVLILVSLIIFLLVFPSVLSVGVFGLSIPDVANPFDDNSKTVQTIDMKKYAELIENVCAYLSKNNSKMYNLIELTDTHITVDTVTPSFSRDIHRTVKIGYRGTRPVSSTVMVGEYESDVSKIPQLSTQPGDLFHRKLNI